MIKHIYNCSAINLSRFLVVLLFVAGCVFLFASCAPAKSAYYFKTIQKDTTLSGLVSKDLESKISKGDNLKIIISSLSREEDAIYNVSPVTGSGTREPGFTVEQDGNIMVHKLGIVKAAGLTRKELAEELKKSLAPFLKDPVVTVQYLNHKVTIMGEVERPSVLNMQEEQLSVLDALVLSGDVKQDARRDHIMIIREENAQKNVKIINLEDHSIFSSPWYYLQPNDIVYVIPDEAKRQKAERRARFQSNFAIASASISLLVILIDRIFR